MKTLKKVGLYFLIFAGSVVIYHLFSKYFKWFPGSERLMKWLDKKSINNIKKIKKLNKEIKDLEKQKITKKDIKRTSRLDDFNYIKSVISRNEQ